MRGSRTSAGRRAATGQCPTHRGFPESGSSTLVSLQRRIGFRVRENPNDPTKWSRAYSSPWIVKNRFEGKVELYRQVGGQGGRLEKLPYPVTNMVLVAEK